MPACPSCGRENPADARFCNACGAALALAEPDREQRKVVTVLFCDLVGSTALGESTDPEALRVRMRRYFDDLRSILERHGGTVEKFVGDAVMAVFGIPAAHEDDALRAVRAASEMRQAVATHGLVARIGINTGGVVVGGEGETLVTGDAVNVAARLEQTAGAGEILIGAETRLLVRDAVAVEAVEPLQLKGKAEPIEAYRLLELVGGEAVARHLDTPLVGRERERQRLWRDYEDAVAERTSRLFTLLGPAGIGKSRLVADFLERVGDSADVLRGRCLSYGEGITYWPLVEILLALGVEPESVIGSSPPETQLAFRRLLEDRAARRPQVVVVDDLQWAELVFVELVEHVADMSRDAPIFLLCIARTELLDVRPGWGGGKVNATSLLLEPLDAEECDQLVGVLGQDAPLDDELRSRITKASAGNPLYVEEMLAMVREHGGDHDEITVPPTIHALLQARIDSLENDVRVVMERGAVEGEVFHRGSVAALAPDPLRPSVEAHLATLVRKELIRSTSAAFAEDEGYRFRHLLIRDAAYESLPKATRAELHERFADWLSTHDLVERDEIVGYHLEQAHRYRVELDGTDPALDGLARRAFTHLAAAGRGAVDRGDFTAGGSLIGRASGLLPEDDEARLALAPDYAEVLFESGDEAAWDVLSRAVEAVDTQTRARATVTMATWSLTGTHERPFAERKAWRDEAREVFESIGDDYGLAMYWRSVGWESWFAMRAADAVDACEHALPHLDRAGAEGRPLAREVRRRLRANYYQGPMPVDEALERVAALGADEYGVLEQAAERSTMGLLLVMTGEVDRGRELFTGARQVFFDAGLLQTAGGMSLGLDEIEFRAGDLDAEERALRDGLELLEGIGDRSYYPTVALLLAECLYRGGAADPEIETLCERARETSAADDVANFIWLALVEGLLHARRGEKREAEDAAGRALALVENVDFHPARSTGYALSAEIYSLIGRSQDAARMAARALDLYDVKGDVTGGARFQSRLESLGIEAADA